METSINSETSKEPYQPNESDLQLLNELKTSGEEKLASFFLEHRDRLFRMVSLRMDHRLRSRVDASDVLQEGFIDAAKRIQEYINAPSMPLFVWLRFLIGQRLAAVHRWHFKTQKRDPRRESLTPSQCHPPADSRTIAWDYSESLTSPSETIAKAEQVERMTKILDSMEPDDREILVLRHFEDLSNNEAAAELNLQKGTASKRYIRALSKLNKAMQQENLAEG